MRAPSAVRMNAVAEHREVVEREPIASTWLSERLTPSEVSVVLGVTVGTLANWRTALRGPSFYKLKPGRVFYLRRDVDTWLAESRVECFATSR